MTDQNSISGKTTNHEFQELLDKLTNEVLKDDKIENTKKNVDALRSKTLKKISK